MNGDAVMPGAEHASRVIAPVRCQHDFCAGEIEQAVETRQQRRGNDKRKLARIGRALAVEDAIDIQKDDFHSAGAQIGS